MEIFSIIEILEPVKSPQKSPNEVYRSRVAAKRPRELCEAKPVALPDSLLVVLALGLSTASAHVSGIRSRF